MTVQELSDDLIFVCDSQEIAAIRTWQRLILPDNNFDSFFVRVGEGEYTEVWGMFGIVPYNTRNVYRVL
jgi:hypothetical protein